MDMETSPGINFENHIERSRIGVLLDKNREALGNFDVVPVGNLGYILQSERQKPMAGNDWVLFDLDDTLKAYTEAKKIRFDLYQSYIDSLGLKLNPVQTEQILEITDKFSRWEENTGEGKLYHLNAHMAALQWATDMVREPTRSIDESIETIRANTDRIKLQLKQSEQPQVSDPFYFRAEDNHLVLRGVNKMWSKEIESIFIQSMVNPPDYNETVEAAQETGQPRDSIHRINLGIFTYGDPYFQLLKVLELMKQHPDLAISHIWLTRGPKGDFIVETAKAKSASMLEQDYVPAELEDYPGEGMSYGSGYVLGQAEHVLVMMDDNPKELSSMLSANDYLKDHTKASFVVVRSKRAGTKEQNREWQVNTPYGELDFTTHSFQPRDISGTFLINRYLNIKSRLGEDHPRTKALLNELMSKGIHAVREPSSSQGETQDTDK